MNESEITDLLQSTGAHEAARESQVAYLMAALTSSEVMGSTDSDSGFDLDSLAATLETLASTAEEPGAQERLFEHAFLCRRPSTPGEPRERLRHLVLLSADGILSNRRPEVMLALGKAGIPERADLINEQTPFDETVEIDVFRAFVLLARRGGGWKDLDESRSAIMQLRENHRRQQESYLQGSQDTAGSGVRLIARFNLAKIVEIASSYTVGGQPVDAEIHIDRHERNLDDLFKLRPDYGFEEMAYLVVRACREIVASSIWKNTRQLGQDFRDFVSALASREKSPTLELWPSQRRAIDQHLLDPARRAVVVEMPTSAGKTLLAEFSIVQAHALNRQSTVAYIVPTRALVNQITQRLRRDFRPLGFVVEAAAPVFELDPTEDQLLRERIDILVCTPEKLDLLIKAGHEAVQDLSLAVVDEAHNLADGDRGVRMELLLGTIKRERPETRFLMLTPFVPNAEELGRWLGDGTDATISVNWRPSERVVTCAHWHKVRRGPHVLSLTTMDSVDNVDVPAGHTVELLRTGDTVSHQAKSVTTSYAAAELAKRGSVLVLARGRGTAETRAADIATLREPRPLSSFAQAVVNYIDLEYGQGNNLARQVEKGVVYHHAGVSHDLRFLLEALIEREDVDVVCGTTTLAQGLNFPISSVVLETINRSQGFGKPTRPLSYSEFWNIAGRAGRALQDSLGLVVFPAQSEQDREEVRRFLQNQAVDICSYLMKATAEISTVVDRFDLGFVRNNSALAVFLQYLAHAARVAGAEESSRDIEELLRSSLVYHQTRENDRVLADQLISIARNFMAGLEDVDRGFLALADGTGFSLPSARFAFAQTKEHPEFRSESFWDADNLFGLDIGPLRDVIQVIADIPELNLALTEDSPVPFNAGTVANIARDWVNGKSLQEIGEKWFRSPKNNTPLKRLQEASHYVHSKLVSQVPWGMGALQKLTSRSNDERDAVTSQAGPMVFYGVPSSDAVAMRMGGVPRAAAAALGAQWSATGGTGESFSELRHWIAERSVRDWSRALPAGSRLSGEECRTLWRVLAGAQS
ncbi:DEAD/DEAH box helicase [Streptomyces rhizosphaericus]|uniref:DEAD/DEAH box helicase n=1 Tax=Streptomyces rhizosphaericus TaxID=114699 RepID=A0ABN1RP62_9ACTN|nr:DEAD/DEAH box helicase [Streptomyces cangkringensis]